jgi:hypothetical protein
MENSVTMWSFLSVIATGILGILGQQVIARRDAKEAKGKAAIAADNAQQAVDNTKPVSNGFASRVDNKLDHIIQKQEDQDDVMRRHLEWHLQHKDGEHT